VQALSSLELLVTIDPIMSNTAKLSHYIVAPKLQYERADLPTTRDYETLFFHVPFSQYTAGVAKPPPGSDVVDDWYVFWALARRLGRTIVYDGVPLDMSNPPTTEDLIAIVTRNSQVSLDEIRKYPGGKIFDREPQYVEPANDSGGRFAVIPPDVADELAEVAAEAADASGAKLSTGEVFTHRLSVRRMREVSNTMYQELPAIRRRRPYNPAWLNPRDLEQLGLTSGDNVAIVSDHGRITAIVQSDETVRPGVVSMSHGWGPLPDESGGCEEEGSPVNRLVSSERDVEAINAMPRQSAIPVNIVRVSP
jgi:anaerobic selenocysteine-containing dehydrogenase